MKARTQRDMATQQELQLVVDSLVESPSNFNELYSDLIEGTIGEDLAEIMISMFELSGEEVQVDKYIALKKARNAKS